LDIGSFDKNFRMKKYSFLSVLFLFVLQQTVGQETHHDTTLKNTIRLNVTPILVTGRSASFTMGYERILKKNQSISANIGHLQLPTLITTSEGDPVNWISNLHNSGFIGSLDYRFYPSRNKYAAPDGLYWGPYVTYYYIDNKSSVELKDNNLVIANADIQVFANLLMAGVQLGYQFVIGDHWTIDMILLGPGFGYYTFSVGMKANAEIIGDETYLQGVYDALVTIFPGAAQLFEEQRLDERGTTTFGGPGFRYVFQVGYRF
jgi:hypothetical protein